MLIQLQRILFWLWPPFEAYKYELDIDKGIPKDNEDRMKKIKIEISSSFPDYIKLSEGMVTQAKLIYESEIKRKDTLENKAIEFTSGFGIVISILSGLPILIGTKLPISGITSVILVILYLLGIIHLLDAVYQSIIARRVVGIALPKADELVYDICNKKHKRIDRFISYTSKVKFNEPIFLKKSNAIYIAETMFKRGLLFISVAAVIGMAGINFGQNKIPVSGCVVPNFVGFDQEAAKGLVINLGLNPIISNKYDANVKAGTIILQYPPAESILKPCEADITMVVSLGPLPTTTPLPSPTPTSIKTVFPTP